MVATPSLHRGSVCHGPARRSAALALAWLGLACAPTQGWQRDDSRVCAADAPATVCVDAEPDRAVEFELGGAVLLPGECARAPAKGGRLRVHWTDEHGDIHDDRVRAPAHRRTHVVLRGDELEVTARPRCDRALGATARPDDE